MIYFVKNCYFEQGIFVLLQIRNITICCSPLTTYLIHPISYITLRKILLENNFLIRKTINFSLYNFIFNKWCHHFVLISYFLFNNHFLLILTQIADWSKLPDFFFFIFGFEFLDFHRFLEWESARHQINLVELHRIVNSLHFNVSVP
jgi:hypothetical protein